MKLINLGLQNTILYEGCEIREVGGRLTLVTHPEEAANIIGRNAGRLIEEIEDHSEITLTGPMAVWAYLVVFHAVLHKFGRVYYEDGQGRQILIAMH